MILSKIVKHKSELVAFEKKCIPKELLFAEISTMAPPLDFKEALGKDGLSIIGEIKKASPSKGVILENFSPKDIATSYENTKVDAVSVLTEEKFFLGDNEYIGMARSVCSKPILRKDFIIEPYQIFQSRQLGADAILIIASIHSYADIKEFLAITHHLGMSAIVEVHNEEELEKSLRAGAEIIGINNRDLKTFETSLSVTEKLIKKIPSECIVVSESGIHTREDVAFLESLGVDALLVGESIMRAPSIEEKVLELRGEL